MDEMAFGVAGWSYWSSEWPGSDAVTAYFQRGETPKPEEQPACENVPPLLRRRCSPLMRMTLEAGDAALRNASLAANGVAKVFASRHGEIQTLQRLFSDLADRNPLSPTAFSNSVHHSAVGYFSLVHSNTLPTRAVSAGRQSLAAGLLETFGVIRRHGIPALMVCADESFPDRFLGGAGENETPAGALALVLVPESPGTRRRVVYRPEEAPASTGLGDLLKWLSNPQPPPLRTGFWNGSLLWN